MACRPPARMVLASVRTGENSSFVPSKNTRAEASTPRVEAAGVGPLSPLAPDVRTDAQTEPAWRDRRGPCVEATEA